MTKSPKPAQESEARLLLTSLCGIVLRFLRGHVFMG